MRPRATGAGPEGGPGRAVGRVTAVGPDGTLVTDLPGPWLRGAALVEVGRRRVAVARAYGDVAPGEAVALSGPHGRVEVGVRDGSAAHLLDAGPGTRVALVPDNA